MDKEEEIVMLLERAQELLLEARKEHEKALSCAPENPAKQTKIEYPEGITQREKDRLYQKHRREAKREEYNAYMREYMARRRGN